MSKKKGAKTGESVLTPFREEIKESLRKGMKLYEIAAQYGVEPRTLTRFINLEGLSKPDSAINFSGLLWVSVDLHDPKSSFNIVEIEPGGWFDGEYKGVKADKDTGYRVTQSNWVTHDNSLDQFFNPETEPQQTHKTCVVPAVIGDIVTINGETYLVHDRYVRGEIPTLHKLECQLGKNGNVYVYYYRIDSDGIKQRHIVGMINPDGEFKPHFDVCGEMYP